MQACQDFKGMFVVNSRPLLRDEMDPKGVAVDNLQGWTQEFRTPDLEEEYADWVARSVLWRDRMHGVISAVSSCMHGRVFALQLALGTRARPIPSSPGLQAWDALAVWSIRGHSVPERHSLALTGKLVTRGKGGACVTPWPSAARRWGPLSSTVPFTALACTAMLLPCLWPKLWIRHRHNLVALCMVSHTIVFAVFMCVFWPRAWSCFLRVGCVRPHATHAKPAPLSHPAPTLPSPLSAPAAGATTPLSPQSWATPSWPGSCRGVWVGGGGGCCLWHR